MLISPVRVELPCLWKTSLIKHSFQPIPEKFLFNPYRGSGFGVVPIPRVTPAVIDILPLQGSNLPELIDPVSHELYSAFPSRASGQATCSPPGKLHTFRLTQNNPPTWVDT